MAQRKSPTSGPAQSRPAGKAASSPSLDKARPGAKATPAKGAPAKGATKPVKPLAKAAVQTAPPRKPGKPGKSIVNQKQTPWGLIATTALVVIFAVAVVAYAITRTSKSGTPYLNELPDAKSINGVVFHKEAGRTHIGAPEKYDTSPPVGGNHSPYWADCTGTVYPQAIANENAVHALEHGAVWVTYKEGLAAAQVSALKKYVEGVDHVFMSPYPGLTSNISLQAWGYQLFLDKADDSRIQQFIDTLKGNTKTTPEIGGSCDNASFKAKPSTFGNPLFAPAS